MLMLVSLGSHGGGRQRWLSELAFLAITVGPYVLLVWLLWPRR
jgi:hypothetical protein